MTHFSFNDILLLLKYNFQHCKYFSILIFEPVINDSRVDLEKDLAISRICKVWSCGSTEFLSFLPLFATLNRLEQLQTRILIRKSLFQGIKSNHFHFQIYPFLTISYRSTFDNFNHGLKPVSGGVISERSFRNSLPKEKVNTNNEPGIPAFIQEINVFVPSDGNDSNLKKHIQSLLPQKGPSKNGQFRTEILG